MRAKHELKLGVILWVRFTPAIWSMIRTKSPISSGSHECFKAAVLALPILVLRKDYLHQGRIKIYSSRLEPETRPINLLLHCIISLMREQRQAYSPIYGELAGIHLHPLESVWQNHLAFPEWAAAWVLSSAFLYFL